MAEPVELIRLARRCVELSSEEEAFAALDEYARSFEQWSQEFLRPDRVQSEADREALQSLAEWHSKVLQRANSLKGELRTQMRDLKKKGKGILAYTDVFPKRIGRMSPRKL